MWHKKKSLLHSAEMRNLNCVNGEILQKEKSKLKGTGILTSGKREISGRALAVMTTLITS